MAVEQPFENKEYIYDDTKTDLREKVGQKCVFDWADFLAVVRQHTLLHNNEKFGLRNIKRFDNLTE